MIEENGYENLTLHKLASKLNIKPASLYTHIQGIDELYVSLANMALKQLNGMMLDAAKGKKRGDAFRAVATAYCTYVKQNPEMYRIIMKIPHSNSEELIKTGRAVMSCRNIRKRMIKSSFILDTITAFCMDLFHWIKLDFLMTNLLQIQVYQI